MKLLLNVVKEKMKISHVQNVKKLKLVLSFITSAFNNRQKKLWSLIIN